MKIQISHNTAIDPLWNKDAPLDKNEIKEWVSTLPILNMERSTNLLKMKLVQVNKTPMSAIKRFGIMEEMVKPLSVIIPELMSHYSHDVYPLPEKSIRFARMVHELMVQYMQGYHAIVEVESDVSWMLKKAYRHNWYTSIHRMFRIFRILIGNFQILNQPYPKNIWKELNRLYEMAYRNGWLRNFVCHCSDADICSTIEYEYIHMVLMSLINQRQIDDKTIQEIEASMGEWISALSLVKYWSTSTGKADFIAISSVKDTAPYVVTISEEGMVEDWRSSCEYVLPLNTLKARLTHYRRKVDATTGTVTTASGSVMRDDTLQFLLGAWCDDYQRKHARCEPEYEYKTTFIKGLHNAHRYLAIREEAAASGDFDESFSMLETLKLKLDTDEVYAIDIHGADIWDRVYNRPAVTKRQQAGRNGIDDTGLSIHECTVLDCSDSGMRVAVHKRDIETIRVGCILGIDNNGKIDVGEIRWIDKRKQDILVIGIRFMMRDAVAATFSVHTPNQINAPLYCLVGVDCQGQPKIVTPAISTEQKKMVVLNYHGNEIKILLTRRLSSSSSFDCYRFCLTGNEDNTTSMCQNKLDIEQLLEHLSGRKSVHESVLAHVGDSNELRLVDEFGIEKQWKII